MWRHSPPRQQATAKLAFQVHQWFGHLKLRASRADLRQPVPSMSALALLSAHPQPELLLLEWQAEWGTALVPSPHLTTALPPKPRLQQFSRDKAGLTK